jgi:uncharacterized membrane protein YagU involved in acid resistance
MNQTSRASQFHSTGFHVGGLAETTGRGSRAAKTIFWAGLICGVLDISAAFTNWIIQGVWPERLLQAIASGLLGTKSYDGGWQTASLGLMCHFFIAFSAAGVFYVASRKLKFLTQHAIASGVAYGVGVYLFMNWIVIPLSRLQQMPFSWTRAIVAIVTHIFCVGLAISLSVKQFTK